MYIFSYSYTTPSDHKLPLVGGVNGNSAVGAAAPLAVVTRADNVALGVRELGATVWQGCGRTVAL
jgi:hypothetical protein